MANVCPKCHYIGEPKYNYSSFDLYYGFFLAIIGLIGFFLSGEIFGSSTIYNLLMLFLVVSGVRQIYGYYKGRICPKCNHKEMLPMDNPEAIKLIKQYDLQPGENKVVKNEQESDSTSPS